MRQRPTIPARVTRRPWPCLKTNKQKPNKKLTALILLRKKKTDFWKEKKGGGGRGGDRLPIPILMLDVRNN